MRTTAARRAFFGTALAIGLPLATAGIAAAQSGPSGPSGPTTTTCPPGPSGASGPSSCATSTTLSSAVSPTTIRASSGLARTGGEAALPLAASAAAITVVLGGRRLANRLHG